MIRANGKTTHKPPPPRPPFEIGIRDLDPRFIMAMDQALTAAGVRGVTVQCIDILAAKADGIVSPANSFGFMDGGIDFYYSQRWPHVQARVQEKIQQLPFKELPIGAAMTVSTDDKNFPVLISAPTMRTPQRIPPLNVYLATRAAVALGIKVGCRRILMPGMGTGAGGVAPVVAAVAMRSGIIDGIAEAIGAVTWPKTVREAAEWERARLGFTEQYPGWRAPGAGEPKP